jgi:hypothetical protein
MYGAQQLAYAPTPYSYTPSSDLAATINLDQEVKLADNATERELYESLAEIYSIIITLDALEKAYLRDSIQESEYTETCDRLLRQYKSNLADEAVADAFGDLERFKAEWHLEVPKATERLRIGIPATVETAPAQQQRPTSQQPTNSYRLGLRELHHSLGCHQTQYAVQRDSTPYLGRYHPGCQQSHRSRLRKQGQDHPMAHHAQPDACV